MAPTKDDLEWLKSNVEKLSTKQREEMKEAFDFYDRNLDGKINVKQLKETLVSLGQDPTDADVAEMIRLVDLDGNGTVEFEEFLSLMAAKLFDKTGRQNKIPWAHKIPIPYVWDSSFSTLYQRIDDEHKNLFHKIWECYENRFSWYHLNNMVATMQQHFTYEEGCMKAAKHDNYERHKQVHDAYMDKLKHFHCPVEDKEIKYCMSWLTNHIKNTDFKYKGKLLFNQTTGELQAA